MNRTLLAVLSASLCSAAALAGCKPAHAPQSQPTATATAEAKTDIVVEALRIVLPRVAEHPAALYFDLANKGSAPARLVGVFVDGATKADMHETTGGAMRPIKAVDLAPGETVNFAPGGKHVMLLGIPGTWKPGDKPAVTLTFADGDKIFGKATVQKAESADAVPNMKM